jgi:membrane-bound lytic murein transglycosylase B
MGHFPVIQSLTTLGYKNRRSKFFRKELMHAFHILNDDHIDLKEFKGEWAGASGQSQFLPSSWRQYAIDHNNDGRRDIWKTHSDIFASIANYLHQHGWKVGQSWGMTVDLPEQHNSEDYVDTKARTIHEWAQLGIRQTDGRALPDNNLEAKLKHPYGGPHLLVFNNFKVLKKYNTSTYYAASVGYLANKICQKIN